VDGLRGTLLPPICWNWDEGSTCPKGRGEGLVVPPCIWTECGGAPTFVCGVTLGCPIKGGCPKGVVLPIGPNCGFVPNCCELELV
jgi:hypothetical protein